MKKDNFLVTLMAQLGLPLIILLFPFVIFFYIKGKERMQLSVAYLLFVGIVLLLGVLWNWDTFIIVFAVGWVVASFVSFAILIEAGLRDTSGGVYCIAWVYNYFLDKGFLPTSHKSKNQLEYPEYALKKDEVMVIIRLNAPFSLFKRKKSITTTISTDGNCQEWTFPVEPSESEKDRILQNFDMYLIR